MNNALLFMNSIPAVVIVGAVIIFFVILAALVIHLNASQSEVYVEVEHKGEIEQYHFTNALITPNFVVGNYIAKRKGVDTLIKVMLPISTVRSIVLSSTEIKQKKAWFSWPKSSK